MRLRSHWVFVLAGLLLIAVANAIVLMGVAYNRKLPTESELILTERELAPSVTWSVARENSGLNLRLNVRTASARRNATQEGSVDGEVAFWGETPWLNAEKLKSLGFPLPMAQNTDEARRRDERLLPRDVYVVLELNGNSYHSDLQAALSTSARDNELAMADPNNKELAQRARNSQRLAEEEQNQSSRLYCIDAGLDANALRNSYADQSKFAIVRGTVRASGFGRAGKWRVIGQFTGVRIDEINVPLDYRAVFGSSRRLASTDASAFGIAGVIANQHHYDVSVGWGRRLEPWIVSSVARGKD